MIGIPEGLARKAPGFTAARMNIDYSQVTLPRSVGHPLKNNSRVLGKFESVRFSAGDPTKIRSLFLASSSENRLPRLTQICLRKPSKTWSSFSFLLDTLLHLIYSSRRN